MPQLFGWDYFIQLVYALSVFFFVVEILRFILKICQKAIVSNEISFNVLVAEVQFNK